MKKQIKIVSVLLGILILSGCSNAPTTSMENENSTFVKSDEYKIDPIDFVDGEAVIEGIAKSTLTDDEINGLILMREEEKLARDAYTVLADKWDFKLFSNIAGSEQTHMDSVKTLLNRYGIPDPVVDNAVGSFNSQELLGLYETLIANGEVSKLDALIVGATIEDLDIKDLNELLEKTDNADIIAVYNNLNRGSRNHLRAFMKQINANNGTYKAQYISQEEFDSILASEQERGRN